jgi:hypothetical protein
MVKKLKMFCAHFMVSIEQADKNILEIPKQVEFAQLKDIDELLYKL